LKIQIFVDPEKEKKIEKSVKENSFFFLRIRKKRKSGFLWIRGKKNEN